MPVNSSWLSPMIWSLGTTVGQEKCGIPVLPCGTREWGKKVLQLPGLVWGWTPPGDMRAPIEYGSRLCADVELKQWSGSEVGEAEELASRVSGVTSHGFGGGAKLAPVLRPFAQSGCVAFPQVYDNDRSREPRQFLRDCVAAYQKLGFDPGSIVPLLGVHAGWDYVDAWVSEAAALGCGSVHLWSLQRMGPSDCAAAVSALESAPRGGSGGAGLAIAVGIFALAGLGVGLAVMPPRRGRRRRR